MDPGKSHKQQLGLTVVEFSVLYLAAFLPFSTQINHDFWALLLGWRTKNKLKAPKTQQVPCQVRKQAVRIPGTMLTFCEPVIARHLGSRPTCATA
jgi:hypothetical protein